MVMDLANGVDGNCWNDPQFTSSGLKDTDLADSATALSSLHMNDDIERRGRKERDGLSCHGGERS